MSTKRLQITVKHSGSDFLAAVFAMLQNLLTGCWMWTSGQKKGTMLRCGMLHCLHLTSLWSVSWPVWTNSTH